MVTFSLPPNRTIMTSAHAQQLFKVKYTLKAHRKSISVVKFSPNGQFLATASADKCICVWSLSSTGDPKFHVSLRGHTQGINDLAWTNDSIYLASASDDTKIRIFNITSSPSPLRILTGHASAVFSLCFNPNNNLLVSGSFDETIRIWDSSTGTCLRVLPAHSDPVTCVTYCLDGTLILSGSYDGLLRIWDAKSGLCLRTLVHPMNPPIGNICVSRNSKYLLVATLDNFIRLWNLESNLVEREFKAHSNNQFCLFNCLVQFDQPGFHKYFVVSGSEDNQLYVWDLDSENLVSTLSAHSDPVLAVDFTRHGNWIASGGTGADFTVKIWAPDLSSLPVNETEMDISASSPILS